MLELRKKKVWIKSAFAHLIHTLFLHAICQYSWKWNHSLKWEWKIVENIYQFNSIYYKFKTKGQYKAFVLTYFIWCCASNVTYTKYKFLCHKKPSIYIKVMIFLFLHVKRKSVFVFLNSKCWQLCTCVCEYVLYISK